MAKLGDKGKAAVVRVATLERAQEIYGVCEDNGWKVVVGIEPEEEEDTSDFMKLLGYKGENTKTVYNVNTIGRNDPCSCGSGKKYKKCCGK